MSKILLRGLVVAVLGLVVALPGSAGAGVGASNGTTPSATLAAGVDPPIPVDAASWTAFSWSLDGQNLEGPFTFTSTGAVLVKVTDAFCRGDEFQVFDFGVLVGRTSEVTTDFTCSDAVFDPDAAFADPTYSHGSFALGAGPHSITIVAVENPFSAGGGYIRVDSLTKDQCKNGGWRNYPGFKNQGDCVSFVATRGKNPPAG